MKTAIHLAAKNDPNGNPQRLYLVLDAETGAVIEAVDEGNRGIGSLYEAYPHFKGLAFSPVRIEVSRSEYHSTLKQFKK